jgi:hypothetical protein
MQLSIGLLPSAMASFRQDGPAAAAPPSSVMNWRRRIFDHLVSTTGTIRKLLGKPQAVSEFD